MKLGFIDYFLDEWHANNYPEWLRAQAAARGLELDLGYAWADTEKGLSTAAWCEKFGMKAMPSQEALLEACDAVIVLSPDNPEHHERLGKLALESGKRVYMDKTFSPDLASGIRLFDKAEAHGTPMFSSSALRFSKELADFRLKKEKTPEFAAVTGPGVYANYSVHQLEMINCILGCGAKRVKAMERGSGRTLWIDYGDRLGTMTQTLSGDFTADIAWTDCGRRVPQCTETFDNLIAAMLTFFENGTVGVSREETLEVIAVREAGLKALESPDTWIPVAQER